MVHTCPESPCALNAQFNALFFITDIVKSLDLHSEKSGVQESVSIHGRNSTRK